MAKAIWCDTVLAESDTVILLEGNRYFPQDAIRHEYFKPSDTQTRCFWKGVASYYSIVVDGQVNEDAAWYYPEPYSKASHIKDHVAFWRGVSVID